MSSPAAETKPVTKPVTITVNGAHVTVPDREVTGGAIKQAAIAAGVPIQTDFVLYERRADNNEYRKIADDEVVTVHPGEKFRAVAPDDVA